MTSSTTKSVFILLVLIFCLHLVAGEDQTEDCDLKLRQLQEEKTELCAITDCENERAQELCPQECGKETGCEID